MNLFAFITSCVKFHIKKVRCELFITLPTSWSYRRRILMNAKQLISENLYFCVFTLRKLPHLTSGVTMQGLPHVVCTSQYAGSATRTLYITVRWVYHAHTVHHSMLGLPPVFYTSLYAGPTTRTLYITVRWVYLAYTRQ